MCGCLSNVPYWGPDLARNPGMCPDWESNWQPFGLQPTLNPLSHTSQGGNFKNSFLSKWGFFYMLKKIMVTGSSKLSKYNYLER